MKTKFRYNVVHSDPSDYMLSVTVDGQMFRHMWRDDDRMQEHGDKVGVRQGKLEHYMLGQMLMKVGSMIMDQAVYGVESEIVGDVTYSTF